jgi:hypothetical protein
VMDRFPANSHSRMLAGVRALCGDEAVARDVRAFLADHPVRTGQRSVDQTLERLDINVAFGARERGRLADTLARVID